LSLDESFLPFKADQKKKGSIAGYTHLLGLESVSYIISFGLSENCCRMLKVMGYYAGRPLFSDPSNPDIHHPPSLSSGRISHQVKTMTAIDIDP
jgi:hypothetical protein